MHRCEIMCLAGAKARQSFLFTASLCRPRRSFCYSLVEPAVNKLSLISFQHVDLTNHIADITHAKHRGGRSDDYTASTVPARGGTISSSKDAQLHLGGVPGTPARNMR